MSLSPNCRETMLLPDVALFDKDIEVMKCLDRMVEDFEGRCEHAMDEVFIRFEQLTTPLNERTIDFNVAHILWETFQSYTRPARRGCCSLSGCDDKLHVRCESLYLCQGHMHLSRVHEERKVDPTWRVMSIVTINDTSGFDHVTCSIGALKTCFPEAFLYAHSYCNSLRASKKRKRE